MACLIVSPNHMFRMIVYRYRNKGESLFSFQLISSLFNWFSTDVCGRCRDSSSAGCSEDRTHSASCRIDDDRWCHGWQGPLAWTNKVRRTRRYSEIVCHVGRRKVVHLIVKDDARLFRAESCTKSEIITIDADVWINQSHLDFWMAFYFVLVSSYRTLMVEVMATAIPLASRTEMCDVPWSFGL